EPGFSFCVKRRAPAGEPSLTVLIHIGRGTAEWRVCRQRASIWESKTSSAPAARGCPDTTPDSVLEEEGPEAGPPPGNAELTPNIGLAGLCGRGRTDAEKTST